MKPKRPEERAPEDPEKSALVDVTLPGHGEFKMTRAAWFGSQELAAGLFREGKQYAVIMPNGRILRAGQFIGTRKELKAVDALDSSNPLGDTNAGR